MEQLNIEHGRLTCFARRHRRASQPEGGALPACMHSHAVGPPWLWPACHKAPLASPRPKHSDATTGGPPGSRPGDTAAGSAPTWPPASGKVARPPSPRTLVPAPRCDRAPRRVPTKGPARRGAAGPHPADGGWPSGLDLSPRPQRRPRVTISQPGACYPGHRQAPRGTGASPIFITRLGAGRSLMQLGKRLSAPERR